MTFEELLAQVIEILQREQRVSYRALKRRFALDDEYVEDLKEELIGAKQLALDEGGRFLVWVGAAPKEKKGREATDVKEGVPGQWTPSHLAERIRATNITDGERKTITALFADLKGSTALIEGLDPEEARAIIDPALQVMMDAVHRYEGYVAQALGDGARQARQDIPNRLSHRAPSARA